MLTFNAAAHRAHAILNSGKCFLHCVQDSAHKPEIYSELKIFYRFKVALFRLRARQCFGSIEHILSRTESQTSAA